MFSFKGNRKMNKVRITLNEIDLYEIEFFKYSPKNLTCDLVAACSQVYAENLIEAIENKTGLYLSL